MLFLNKLYPLYLDDWAYSFIFGLDHLERVDSFHDIIISQINHYKLWGGRTVAHFIAQSLLMFDTPYQDILNSLAYTILIFILYKISNWNNKSNAFTLLLIFCLFFIFSDTMYADVSVWITGCSNYMWTLLIILLYLYPWFRYYKSDKDNDNRLRYIKSTAMFLIGILAGWTNENSVPAVLFLSIALFVLFRYERKKIPLWTIVGFLGLCIGGMLLYMAPGNYIRMVAEQDSYQRTHEWLSVNFWLSQLYTIGHSMINSRTAYLIAVYIATFAAYMLMNRDMKNHDKRRKIFSFSVCLFIASLVSSFSLVMVISALAYRSFFFSNVMLIVAIMLLITEIRQDRKIINYLFYTILILVFSLTIWDSCRKVKTISFLSNIIKERENYIEKEKEKGNLNIVVSTTFCIHPKYRYTDYAHQRDSDFFKPYYLHLKGIKSLSVADNAVYLQP